MLLTRTTREARRERVCRESGGRSVMEDPLRRRTDEAYTVAVEVADDEVSSTPRLLLELLIEHRPAETYSD